MGAAAPRHRVHGGHGVMGSKKALRLSESSKCSRLSVGIKCGLNQTITLDCGTVQSLTHLTVHAFVRSPGMTMCIRKMRVEASQDGVAWSQVGEYDQHPAINREVEQPGDYPDTYRYDFDFACEARYLRLVASPNEALMKIWWGEIVVQGVEPLARLPHAERIVTTPLWIKKSLDQALLTAGVRHITGTAALGALVDQTGQVSGAVLVGRSGRFVVKAKVVIDATESARVARSAGAAMRPFLPGSYEWTQVVVAGSKPAAAGLQVRTLDGAQVVPVSGMAAPPGMPSVITGLTYACTMTLALSDNSVATLAAAQQSLRSAVFVPTQLDTAEMPWWISSEAIVAEAPSTDLAVTAATLPLAALRPAGIASLLVLSPLADVARSVASGTLAAPANLMALGARVGAAAAAEAVLQAYAADPRSAYARHALLVLEDE